MANNYTVRDGNGNSLTISSTDVGTGVEAPNVRVCDATAANFMPVMAAVGSAGYIYVTDGTHTMPTGDAAARPVYVDISDGTRVITVKAASTAAQATDTALVVRPMMPTDGTNTQPAMDAVSRAGYVAPVATATSGTSKPTAGSPIQNLNASKVAVKASAGTLYGFIIENAQNAITFVQLFDAASGSVTLGTNKPDLEIAVAANGGSGATMYALPLPAVGWPFGTALTIAATTTSGGNTGSANGISVFPVYA